MTRNFRRLTVGLILMLALAISVLAQRQQQEDTYLDPSLPEGITVRQIISRFAAKEQEYKQAREHYTYRQSARIQTISENGFADGEYDDTFDVTLNDQGERIVKQISSPRNTLKRISITPEDIDDLRNRMPFVLTTDEIPDYNIRYKGQQDTSGTHCYVLDISPKAMEENRRYFEGRIWVDVNGYQIVKTSGKAVPDIYSERNENLFPSFTTYRELVDDKYWFPSYTKSDDYLHFSEQTVHVIETVNYTNYKRFGAESRIIFEGKEVGDAPPQQQTRAQAGNDTQPQTNQRQQYPNRSGDMPASSPPQRSMPQPQQQAPPLQRSQPPPVNPPAQPAQFVQQTLISLEREISGAINAKEVSILERILTDDYRLVSANGDAEDKFNLLDDIHQGRAGTFGQPENMQVQVNGDRATVVGERDESVPVGKNKMQTARVRFTDTFIRRAGEWLLTQTKEAGAR